MASNSEANLSSDFDIDEVINWDEQNYSSKVNIHPIYDEENIQNMYLDTSNVGAIPDSISRSGRQVRLLYTLSHGSFLASN
jgi:hypothetical protein